MDEKQYAVLLTETQDVKVIACNLDKDIFDIGREAIGCDWIELVEAEPLAKIDYVKVVDLMTMQQIPKLDRPFLAAIAVYIGKTRLIDNFMMQAGGTAE